MFDEETFEIHVLNPTEESGIVSNDFHTGVIDPNIWTFIDPKDDCSFSLTGAGTADAWANIILPAGSPHSLYTTGLTAPHLVQDVNDTDFEVEIKFESPVTLQYQEQGIIVKRDPNGFMRLEFFSNGTDTYLYARSFELDPASNTTHVNKKMTGTPPYMRVGRTDDTWTLSYSYNGSDWTAEPTFDHAIEVKQIGFYGGNESGTGSPAHTVQVDYFFNTASPIIDEDPLADADGDGYLDAVDNCPGTYNPDQNDIDTDGFGDVCDNCEETANPGQEDDDSDGIGNACECTRANVNSIGNVNLADFAIVTQVWMSSDAAGDLDKDGDVDIDDVMQVAQWWLDDCL
jgi:hypothetical protein